MSPSLIPRSTFIVHAMYGLHAFSAVNGLLSPALIVTAFLSGWPSIIAVIINYVKRGDVRGTWLDSHFSWQLRTFWWAAVARRRGDSLPHGRRHPGRLRAVDGNRRLGDLPPHPRLAGARQ